MQSVHPVAHLEAHMEEEEAAMVQTCPTRAHHPRQVMALLLITMDHHPGAEDQHHLLTDTDHLKQ